MKEEDHLQIYINLHMSGTLRNHTVFFKSLLLWIYPEGSHVLNLISSFSLPFHLQVKFWYKVWHKYTSIVIELVFFGNILCEISKFIDWDKEIFLVMKKCG